jgi:hypothetical protein
MKLEIIESDTLRKVPGTEVEVKGNRRYQIFNVYRVANTFIGVFFGTLLLCVIVGGIIYNTNKNELETEISILKSENMDTKHVNMLISKSGKYAIAGKQAIPTDSLIKVYELAMKSDAWYPEVIYAQAVLESSSGKSELAQTCNNLFGMKKASTRPNTQINYMVNERTSLEKIYGVYMNWQHSVIDRILWDEWVFSGKKPTREQYMAKLGGVYAEDKQYVSKLNKIIERSFGE